MNNNIIEIRYFKFKFHKNEIFIFQFHLKMLRVNTHQSDRQNLIQNSEFVYENKWSTGICNFCANCKICLCVLFVPW